MNTPTPANPTPKPAPWAAIRADDQELLATELGPEAGATALAVWFRLTLAGVKAQSTTVSVPYGDIARETRLGLRTIARRVADLTRLGYVTVAPVSDPADWTSPTRFTLCRGILPKPAADAPPVAIVATPGCQCVRDSVATLFPTSLQEALNTKHQENTPLPPEGGEVLPFASDAFKSAWGEWETHLRQKRSRLTPLARKKQLAKLAAMSEPDAIATIGRCIERNWKGIFAPDEHQARPRTTTTIKAPADDYTNIPNEVLQ